MTVSFDCPNCGKTIRTSDANAGKRGKCPACGEATVFPELSAPVVGAESSTLELHDPNAVEETRSAFPPLALALSMAAALLGAALWAVILAGAQSEIGWLAWGIGGLVGMGAVMGGGRGVPMAVTAAMLAVLSIFGGKWFGASIFVDQQFEEETQALLASPEMDAVYSELQSDSRAWAEFAEPPSDEVLALFMVDRGFTEAPDAGQVTDEELAFFRNEQAPELEEFAADPLTREEWNVGFVEDRNEYRPDVDMMEVVVEGLGSLDLLFVGLGISTAWGLVIRNSKSKRRSRRSRTSRSSA